jgi:hypothetical protein
MVEGTMRIEKIPGENRSGVSVWFEKHDPMPLDRGSVTEFTPHNEGAS